MKLIFALTLICYLLYGVSGNPFQTVKVVEEPEEILSNEEGNIRLIEVPEESLRADEDDPYRLPTSVLPKSYSITLKLEEDFGPNGVFTGSVSIVLEVQEAVSEIVLHAQYLDIKEENVILNCNGDNANLFSSLTNATSYHKITIVSSSQIVAGSSCTLQINDYSGILDDDMRGLYRSSYTNKDGEVE